MFSPIQFNKKRRKLGKQVSHYVEQALDEFGKQRFGLGGCVFFRGRTYKIYSNYDTGNLPEWLVISNMAAVSHKYTDADHTVYKYASYRLLLDANDKVLDEEEQPKFILFYGGYIDEAHAWEETITFEQSQEALRLALAKIVAEKLGPLATYSFDIDTLKTVYNMRQVR